MAGISLRDYQEEAIHNMKNGCILCGGVGSGKSRTALAYYYICQIGRLDTKNYVKMSKPKDLYIITTARKRDTYEWDEELIPFMLSQDPEKNVYDNKVVIDSWNNIGKYIDVRDAFFIFDEQRVVGSGAWVKAFYKIAKMNPDRTFPNDWILLSATPGDTWQDYIPVFVANGFYKNKSEFVREHAVYNRYSKYPRIDRYINTKRLERLRDSILIDMRFERQTISHHEDIFVDYPIVVYRDIQRRRWDIWKDEPIENASKFCYCLRRVVNSSEDRQKAILELFEKHPRVIIFYNYDYELEILRNLCYGPDVPVAEWNSHKHEEVPDTKTWVYLVQYNAGAEGWNCIKTDTIIFYSQSYSYKMMKQASGRIDRMNTPYKDLYYYHLKSRSGIDLAISRALKNKKQFNERKFTEKIFERKN